MPSSVGRSRVGLRTFRIACSVAAAVDQHDAGHALRNQPRRFQHHPAAHAVTDEDDSLQLQVVDEGGDITAVVLDRALVRPAWRLAMPAQVAGGDFMRLLEMLELRLPIVRRAGETVDEDEGGSTFAGVEEMHGYPRIIPFFVRYATMRSTAASGCTATVSMRISGCSGAS